MSARLTPQPRRAPRPRRPQLRFPHADRFLRQLHGSPHPNASAPPPGAHRRDAWSGLVRWLQANTFAPRWMPARLRHPLLGYLFAVLLELLAASITVLLLALFPLFTFHAILLLVSVVVIALGWGAGPGLWATLIGAFLTCYALLPPYFSWKLATPADALGLGFSVVVGVSFSLLVSRSERARRQTEALAERLAQAQAKSEADYRRLQSVLEVLPVGVFIADATGRLLETNPACRAIWGEAAPLVPTTAEYGAYQGWWPGTEVRLAPEDWALARALKKGETTLQEEIDIQTFDRQRKMILNNAVPVRDATGAIAGGVVAILDISERKRLEEALRQAQQEAEARARELEAIFEALTDGLLVYDAEGRILRSNPAARQLLGFEAQPEFASLSWQERFCRYAARDAEGQPVPLAQVTPARLLRGEVLTGAQAAEERLETPDGREVTFGVTGRPLRDAEGHIIGAVVIGRDETERRRLEREVAARARELEAIFEALTDGLLVYDAEGRILRSNTAARQLLGFEAQPEFASLSWQERAVRYTPLDAEGHSVLPEDLALSRLLCGEVLTGSQTAEDCLHTPDGREVAFSMTGRPLRDAEGRIIGAVAIARDETERRRLEREVAERAAQLEAIFESIADGISVTDRAGRVLHMNQANRTLLGIEQDPTGLTPPQLEALAGYAAYTPTGQRLIEGTDPIPRVLQGEILTNEQSVDNIVRTRAGRETQVNTTGAPIRDATGQLLGAVFVSRDVTEQRRLEQQTREVLEALLAMAEALVQAPGETSAAPAAGTQRAPSEPDPALPGVARRLAELTRRVLGFESVSMVAVDPTTEQMTPITIVGFSPEHEQQWWASWDRPFRLDERLPPHLAARLLSGEPGLIESTEQPQWWHPLFAGMTSLLVPMHMGDTLVGVLRLENHRTHPARTRQQEKAVTQAVARLGALVLERGRLLRERTEARANELALRETQAQMETFLGMAGHELKNPLTGIKLSLQLIERRIHRRAQDESDRSHPLAPFLDPVARAEHQADRLERLVNDLLDVSRVRAGKLDLHPEPADLAAIVREAVEEQREIHPERTLIFQFAPPRVVPITADADRLGQVVTNYLTNALKYSPADRPVTVGLDLDEGQARVWVRDEGPGLPPEEQDRIWERFHRVKGIEVQSGSGVGLGLGLHICRTIIERHQGQVGVESAPGQGSTFWFTLPLGAPWAN